MKFTERELHQIILLISNEIENTSIVEQQARELGAYSGDTDLQAYHRDLLALERRVVEAIETGDWYAGDEPPISARDPNEAEAEPYEPTQAELDAFDAYFEDMPDVGLLE